MKKNFLLLSVLGLLVAVATTASCFQPLQREDIQGYDFSLSDLSGQTVSLNDFAGQKVILFFWTTWCPHCRGQLRELNKNYHAMKQEGIVLLSINVGESRQRVERFVDNYSLAYPVLLDYNSNVSHQYDVRGVPTLVLLSSDHIILQSLHSLPSDYQKYFSE